MAIRVRKDGTMWCAALTVPMDGDTYIDDGLHYRMSAELGVIVALPEPEHTKHPQWWWVNAAPPEADCWNSAERGAVSGQDGTPGPCALEGTGPAANSMTRYRNE